MMNEITYTMQGDYLLPDLTMPEQPELSMAGTPGCGRSS